MRKHTLGLLLLVLALAACNPADSTPPYVTSLTPLPRSQLDVATPLTVTFSEAIDPASISAVELNASGSVLAADLNLSTDGKTLAISLSEDPPSYPAEVSVSLSGLKDKAGNALIPLAEPWKLTVPEWLVLNNVKQHDSGSYRRDPRMAQSSSGEIYVAYWATIPPPTDRKTNRYTAFAYKLGAGGEEPLGSYLFDPGCASCADQSGSGATNTDIAVDSSGAPVVANSVFDYDSGGNLSSRNLAVSYWNGSVWGLLGNVGISGGAPNSLRLAAGPDGRLAIAFNQLTTVSGHSKYHLYLQRYDGSNWLTLSASDSLNHDNAQDAWSARLAFDPASSGATVAVAWIESNDLMLRYCDEAGSCTGADTVTGGSSLAPSLYDVAYDNDGNTLLLYSQNASGGGRNLIINRYKGLSLETLTVAHASNFDSADMLRAPNGDLLVAWGAQESPDAVHASRYHAGSFHEYSPAFTAELDTHLYNVQVGLDASGRPLAHWGGEDDENWYYDYTALLNHVP